MQNISSDTSKIVAAFDFDGTLTKTDTFRLFLLHCFGLRACLRGLWDNKRILTRYMLGRTTNHQAKQTVFSYFFKGMKQKDFDDVCSQFARTRIPGQLKTDAMEKLNWHIQNGHMVVLVSASIENWILPWAETKGVDIVLATIAGVKNDILTGRFSGANCYGSEKVRRLLERFPNRQAYQLFAYGDSRGDRELLALADVAFYRRFS